MKTHDAVVGLNATPDGQFVSSESHSTPLNRPGEIAIVLTADGERWYRYMKAEEAFAQGQVAMIAAVLVDADVDQAQAIGDKVMKATGDFTAGSFGASKNSSYPDGFVSTNANTGAGQTRYITNNRGSADYINLDKGWSIALDTTTDYVAYAVNYVSLSDTDDVSARASKPRGVAISAVTDESWAWFQIYGFCPLVRFVGSTDAAIRGAIITASSTAGAAKGPTAGGTTADDVASSFGHALYPYAVADSAGIGIAAFLTCL